MNTPTIKNDLNRAIALNYLYIILTNLSSIVLTRMLTQSLGLEQYGLYTLVIGIIAYILVVEFSIGTVIIKHVSEYREKGDKKAESRFLCSSMLAYILMCGVATIFCVVFYFVSPAVLAKQTPEIIEQFRGMFAIAVLNFIVLFFQNFFFSIATGYEKHTFVRVIMLIKLLIRTTLIVLLLVYNFDAKWIFITDLVLNSISAIVFACYCFFSLGVRIRISFGNAGEFKSTLSYLMNVYGYMILDNIFWNVGGIIFAYFGNVEDIGIYGIAMTFCMIFLQVTGMFAGYYLPDITKMVVNEATPEMFTDAMIKTGRFICMLVVLIIIGFAVAGEAFITVWAGEEFRPAFMVALMIMLSQSFLQVQCIGETMLQASNKYGFRLTLQGISTLTCCILSFYMIKLFGLSGAWIGAVVPIVLFRIITMNIYYAKQGIDIGRFFSEVVLRMLIIAAICIGAAWLVQRTGISGILGMLITLAATLAVYVALLWILYLKADEKTAVVSVFKKFRRA